MQIGANPKAEMAGGHQCDRKVVSIVMYSRSVRQYHGKSVKGFALTSAYQPWKDEIQVLQPSVICRANVKTV